MKVQVAKEHYNFVDYVDEHRWSSYYCQIAEILRSNVSKIMVIGKGDGLAVQILHTANPNLQIETFDFDSELHPDIVGDVRKLSECVVSQYDAILCCQVLEHLAFDEFEQSVMEISACIQGGGIAIISLPDSGVNMKVQIKLPKIWINCYKSLCRFWKKDFQFNGEHYWEINSAIKYRCAKIRKILERYFAVKDEYCVENNTYHRFFILEKK